MNKLTRNIKFNNNNLRPTKRRSRRKLPHRGGRRGRRLRGRNQSYTDNESLGVLSPVDELAAQYKLLTDFVDFFKTTDPTKLRGFSGLLNPKFFIDTLTESINAFEKELANMSFDDQMKLQNALEKAKNILKQSINTTAEEAGQDAGDIAYNTLLAALTPVPFAGPSLMIISAILDNFWMIFSFIAETKERIKRTILKIIKIPGIDIVLRIVNTILATIKNAITDLPQLRERVLERQAPPIMPMATPQQPQPLLQQPQPQPALRRSRRRFPARRQRPSVRQPQPLPQQPLPQQPIAN